MYPNKAPIIAISQKDFNEFGCPYCGYYAAHTWIEDRGTKFLVCEDEKNCAKVFCVLADGVIRSSLVVDRDRPKLQDHPRKDIPHHGSLENI
jgi:hypothetical protein